MQKSGLSYQFTRITGKVKMRCLNSPGNLETVLGYHIMTLYEVSHLEALNQYLEAQGVANISQLPRKISRDETVPMGGILPADD
jgi:hypothetical protein